MAELVDARGVDISYTRLFSKAGMAELVDARDFLLGAPAGETSRVNGVKVGELLTGSADDNAERSLEH
jgi:hypothetical protein